MAVAHRIYARAFLEAADEKDRLAEVREQLGEFVRALDEAPALDALLVDREIESRVKAGVLEEVLTGADELVRNLLLLLVEKGRAAEIREVAAEFESLVAAREQVLDVELTTAHPLSEREFEQIRADIEARSGRKVQATHNVDPELIGGLVLQAGSMRLDASVRGRLDRLRQELAATR